MDCVAGSSNPRQEEKKEKKILDCVPGEEKKLVCLNLGTEVEGLDVQGVWHIFDPLETPTHQDLRPIWTPKSIPVRRITSEASEACGSKLYMFGGMDLLEGGRRSKTGRDYLLSDEIVFFDTTNIDAKLYKKKKLWKTHSRRMLLPRFNPTAITVEKKIYLFGGDPDQDQQWWGEVFDTESGFCSPIDDPHPVDIKRWPSIQFVAVHNKTILLGASDFSNHMYSYDTQLKRWLFHENHPLICKGWPSFRNVVVDNLLYTFSGMGVYVYNLVNDIWYKSPVQGLFQDLSQCCPTEGFVFQLGNKKLCAGFLSITPEASEIASEHGIIGNEMKLHCATFTPLIDDDTPTAETLVKADVESCVHYDISACCYIDAALVPV